jgi:type IV secretion system protein VirD4
MPKSTGPRGLYDIRTSEDDPINALTRIAGSAVFLIMFAFWGATEFTAYRFSALCRGEAACIKPWLGVPLAGQLYSPWDGLVWAFKWRNVHDPRVSAVFLQQWIVLGIAIVVAVGLCVYLAQRTLAKAHKHSDLHGSAHWATKDEVEKAGLIGKGAGAYVGAFEDDKGKVHYLRHNGPEHILAFAPTRSGKGVGLVLPTLLSWPDSVVVHDIKGENWALTSGWRSKDLNSRCFKFDPTATDGSCSRFNPLNEVRLRTQYEMQDVQNIVGLIVDPDGTGGGGGEAHWIATSSMLLCGVALHVLYAEPDKSLGGVAKFLSDPSFTSTEEMFQYMLNATHDPDLSQGWKDSLGQPTGTHQVVAMAARDMLNKDPKEAAGVLSTATRFLTLFRDPIVAANIAESDFTINDLMNDERPVSLYIVVPPSDIARVKPLTRLLISQILSILTSKMDFKDGKSVAGYKHRLLLMIDELPSLGKLEILQTSLAYIAGYGLKAYLITQDLGQLTAAYGGSSGRDESIVANCHCMIAYAPNKLETMELLSKLAGNTTIRTENKTYSGGRMAMMKGQVTVAVQEQERPLLTPDEARRLPPDDALVFIAGHPPIYGKKIKYYQDPVFSERAKIPPAVPDRKTQPVAEPVS